MGSGYHDNRWVSFGYTNADAVIARCLSSLNSKLSLVGRGYSWMGDYLGIASC